MSFEKASQLIDLAILARGHSEGVGIDDVIDYFKVSKRTAQRMLHTLELQFLDVEVIIDESRHKRWLLRANPLRDLISLAPEDLASLDLAAEMMDELGRTEEAEQLNSLGMKIRALVPTTKIAALETDYEALFEAQGLATRPGPKPFINPENLHLIGEAIKGCRIVEIDYRGRSDQAPRLRQIFPYGFLYGFRQYVIAKTTHDKASPMRLYRLDNISAVKLSDEFYERDPDFNLKAFSKMAFGVFQNKDEYGEVIWRFSKQAAEHARGFVFHPDQVFKDRPDGTLDVRFMAAGHLEMCWYLYCWGDQVEVIKPIKLKNMCEKYMRKDFPVLP